MGDACCGPEPTHDHDEAEVEPEHWWQARELQAAVLSGVLLLVALIGGLADAADEVVLAFQIGALAVGGWTFIPSTLRRLVHGSVGVGTLMTIAAAGAVILGEVAEAAMLAFLFSISEGLEKYSLTRTRRGLRALLSLVPEQATVLRDGTETVVAIEQLRVGDRLIIKPGERVATDGVIETGRSSVDTSAITGESIPVETGPGGEIYAGSINGSGVLEITVTAGAEDNSLARIVKIVEAEQGRKGTSQRLADRIAQPLVPGIMLAATAIAVIGSLAGEPALWIERALVVLVAASPCALAISVPVTVVAAIGAASRHGVLIKGGAALEALGAVRTVAVDKTGTLTRNQPTVVDIATTNGATTAGVLKVAAALEARSDHPLAAAILAATDNVTAATDVEAVAGAGLTGTFGDHTVRLGRPGWIDPDSLSDTVQHMQHSGATVVLVEHDGDAIGAIAVRDELRSEAGEVVDELQRHGYQVAMRAAPACFAVGMLSGDNHTTATALADTAGIGHVHAELRPEHKSAIVAELKQHQPTAMVGDGINDAPALATSTVGIAMGAMGSDIAIETTDVALMGEDLRHLPYAFAHARHARHIMLQNIGLSLGLIAVLIPLALTGLLGLAAVVLVHELAEVIVIGNGVRAGHTTTSGPQPHRRDELLPTGRLESEALNA